MPLIISTVLLVHFPNLKCSHIMHPLILFFSYIFIILLISYQVLTDSTSKMQVEFPPQTIRKRKQLNSE